MSTRKIPPGSEPRGDEKAGQALSTSTVDPASEVPARRKSKVRDFTKMTDEENRRENARSRNTTVALAVRTLESATVPEWRAITVNYWATGPCDAPPTATELVTPDTLHAMAVGLALFAGELAQRQAADAADAARDAARVAGQHPRPVPNLPAPQ